MPRKEIYQKYKEKCSEYNKNYYSIPENRERRLLYSRTYRVKYRQTETYKQRAKEYRKYYIHTQSYKESRIKNRVKYNEVKLKRRLDIISLLGQVCSNPECLVPGGCTDIRCLQLDHKNGGGLKEVKLFNGSHMMYNYYRKNPEIAKQKLQVLCANCNWIKRALLHESSNRYNTFNGKSS